MIWQSLSFWQQTMGILSSSEVMAQKYGTRISLPTLDNDGALEIVAGGFDKRIYAWHHDGRLVDGFPTWSDLIGRLADNT
jgi:hypothetical protein